MNFNTWGYINSYGIFEAYYIDNLHLGASAVSWTASIQIFLLCFIGVFSGRALDAGYYRPVVALGCFFQLFGIFMTSLCDEYWQLFLAQGVCQGIGNGLVFTPTLGLVSTYFLRRRNFAVNLVLAGSVSGGFAFPLMAQHLLPSLGFAWTVRVMGFVMLFNVAVILTLARTRIPPRRSGPLLELSAFKELPYLLFAVATFLALWPVYYAYDYVCAISFLILPVLIDWL
jgi:MFS family permease